MSHVDRGKPDRLPLIAGGEGSAIKERRAQIEALAVKLEREYGRGKSADSDPSLAGRPHDAVGTLVAVMLSQATNDKSSWRAYRRLIERFPTWEVLADAAIQDIEEAIRPAGLAEQKAPRIRWALGAIQQRSGCCSLDFLRDMEDEQAMDYLESLPGVGPKTAACVLLFAYDRPVFPVDTHVARVARRMGLVPERAGAPAIQRLFNQMVPHSWCRSLHLNLIEHGRTVCLSRSPCCDRCLLRTQCRFGDPESAGARWGED